MRILGFMFLALGVIGLFISLALLGFAALGLLGILADVGPNENRAIGFQSLTMGLPALLCGAVLCVLGLVVVARNRRRTDAEQGDPADGRGMSAFPRS